jgi:deoxyribonuclease V
MASFEQLHDWTLTPREAIELQKRLRERVRIEPLRRRVETVAGDRKSVV